MRSSSRSVAGLLAVAFVSSPLFAADGGRLAKADVEALVVGKEVRYQRSAEGGGVVAWDVRGDGSIWYTPKTQRAVSIGGNYTVEDDGGFCIKWREDKYVRLTDGCYYFVRDGGKTILTGRRNPERVIGELVE